MRYKSTDRDVEEKGGRKEGRKRRKKRRKKKEKERGSEEVTALRLLSPVNQTTK